MNRDLKRNLSNDGVLDSRKSGSDFQRRDSGFGRGYNFVGRVLFSYDFVISGFFLGFFLWFFLSFFFRFSGKEVNYTLNKCGLFNGLGFFFFGFFKFLNKGIINGRLVNNRLVNNGLVDNRFVNNRLVNNRLVNNRLVNNRGLDGGNEILGLFLSIFSGLLSIFGGFLDIFS